MILVKQNGMVPWPDGWTVRRYNACNEPCDMLVGPCACGAWHYETEPWVQQVLKANNSEIVEMLYCPTCKYELVQDAEQEFIFHCSVCGWSGHPGAPKELPPPACKMPYVSIDLETTGLDPETCQILEIGAVYDDWTRPLADLPIFHKYIAHPLYTGQPYALAMNANILKRLSGNTYEPEFSIPETIVGDFQYWLNLHYKGTPSITPAGKNFSSFDLPFLKKFPGWNIKISHRAIDPAMFYWRLDDEKLPDTKTCMERAGIKGEVAHTAVEDAIAVVKLIRHAVSHK